jgi:glucose/arabinose dehydrogenase
MGVRDGAFYGWPWYYLGANEYPRHRGERPDLKDKITIPDVLIQAHSASMGMIVYNGDQFPSEYRGDAFAAQARLLEPGETDRLQGDPRALGGRRAERRV